MNIPNVPTDNLYKFLIIAALAVTGGVNEANILAEIRRAKGSANWIISISGTTI